MHISPLVLPQADYDLETRNIAGSTSVAFSASGTPVTGAIQAGPVVTFSQTGTVFGRAVCVGSESIDFTNTGNLTATAVAVGNESITWTATGLVQATGSLQTASSIDFSASATAQTGTMSGSTSIAFSQSGTTLAVGSLLSSQSIDFNAFGTILNPEEYNVSPLVLPIGRYVFRAGEAVAQGSTSFGFSNVATLTGTASFPGNLRANVSFAEIFNLAVWLQGKGELQAAGTIAFSTSGKLTANKLLAASSVDFSESATVTATGQLQGSTSVDFSEVAEVILIKSIQGSTSIAFSETSALDGTKGKLKAATVIRFINPGSLLAPVFGSTSFDITASATLFDGTVIPIVPEPDLRLESLEGTIRLSALPVTEIKLESLDSEVKLWQAA